MLFRANALHRREQTSDIAGQSHPDCVARFVQKQNISDFTHHSKAPSSRRTPNCPLRQIGSQKRYYNHPPCSVGSASQFFPRIRMGAAAGPLYFD
jgi:hypothetical protein